MEIPLTQGKIAQIEDKDWPLVSPYSWYAARTSDRTRWYAHATPTDGNKHSTKIRMHNLILGMNHVDHRDGDGLNNRRYNLRPCTNAQNQQNTGPRGGTSQFKGVSWYSRYEKWKVAFNCQGKTYFVGYFADEIEAARAYNLAILPLAGEFARLNVVK
jgi:hypothetical protein